MKKNRDQRLENVQDFLKTNSQITTKNLKEFKVTPTLIKRWLNDGTLICIKEGIYKLGTIKPYKKKYQKLLKPLERFTLALEEGNFEEASSIIPLIKTVPLEKQRTYYFHLKLLSKITPLPHDYKNWVRSLQFTDFCLEESRKSQDNQVRYLFFMNHSSQALKCLKTKYQADFTQASKEDLLIFKLLKKVTDQDQKDFKQIISYEQAKEYEQLALFLEEKEKQTNLSVQEDGALNLTRTILATKNKKLKVKHYTDSKDVFEAISNQDYLCAYELNQTYHENMKTTDNLLDLLLEELLKIEKRQNQQLPKNPVPLADLFYFLLKGETERLSKKLNIFLIQKGEERLLPIIKSYIRIDELKENTLYQETYRVLTEIDQGTYQYSLLSPLLSFSETVYENQELASCYLNILKVGEKLCYHCPFLPQLEQQLNNSKEKIYIKQKEC